MYAKRMDNMCKMYIWWEQEARILSNLHVQHAVRMKQGMHIRQFCFSMTPDEAKIEY